MQGFHEIYTGIARARQVASLAMIGGLAVRNNLLCVTWSAGRGHVFLYDLDTSELLSSWCNPVGSSGFSDAGGIAIDRDFRIFIADAHNNCVHRFNVFGQHLGDLGLPMPTSGDRGRDKSGVLDQPHAVATYGDCVYVAMGDRPRQRAVQCFHVDGRVQPGLPARGDHGAKWGAPRGLFADEQGVWVADTLRGRIQRFRHDGVFVQELELGEKHPPARPGHLVRMASGTLVVVDHGGVESRLCAIRASGQRLPIRALAEKCPDPLALAMDDQQRVYVLDHGGERVVRATSELAFDRVMFDLTEQGCDASISTD